ncbi:MAG: Replicative DNA helicase, partial [Candidatus Woesebacteria bacterium GW2011_GWE2_31_6]
ATSTLPASGRTRVVRILTAVVLPAPLGPRRPKIVPLSTSREMSSRAVIGPYCFLKFSMRTTVSDMSVEIYYAAARKSNGSAGRRKLLSSKAISIKKKGYEDIYNVQIQGKENQIKFIRKINFVGIKANKSIEALLFLKRIKSNPNNDVIPKEIWEYIESIRREECLTTREFHKKMGWAYSGTQRHGNGVGRERLDKIAKILEDKYLSNLANSDLYWDEIASIEKIGIKKVYDLTVPKYSIWREDDEKIENIRLDVAKHRNGPLASVPLFFKGDRIKFYARDVKSGK